MGTKKSVTDINYKGKKDRELSLMALPAVIWYICFCYIPLFGVFFAFKHFTPVPGDSLIKNLFVNSSWAGLNNFSFLLRSSDMPQIMANTVFYNVSFIILNIAIPVFLAVFLTELHSEKLKGMIQMTMILPYFLSWVIVGYLVYAFLSTDEGMANHVLKFMGQKAVQWYQTPKYWKILLIIAGVWKSTGYSMIIYLCAITSIDRSLYESAVLDGATFMERVHYITLPILRPTICTIFILSIGSILNSDFGLFYQVPMNSSSLQSVTQTLDVYVYKALMEQANFSFSAAASFLQSVIGFVFLMLANGIIARVDNDSKLL